MFQVAIIGEIDAVVQEGTITDENRQPIPGRTLVIVDKRSGTTIHVPMSVTIANRIGLALQGKNIIVQ